MEVQEIDVFIDQDGQVRLEVRGAQGGACLDLTAGLEQALGGQIASREMTPEAQAAAEAARHAHESQRGG